MVGGENDDLNFCFVVFNSCSFHTWVMSLNVIISCSENSLGWGKLHMKKEKWEWWWWTNERERRKVANNTVCWWYSMKCQLIINKTYRLLDWEEARMESRTEKTQNKSRRNEEWRKIFKFIVKLVSLKFMIFLPHFLPSYLAANVLRRSTSFISFNFVALRECRILAYEWWW